MMLRLFSTACFLVVSFSCHAGGLNLQHVPADAKWLIHVDYAGLSDTGIVKSLRDQKPQLTKMIQNWSKQRYGINPPEELDSVTMFSSDYRPYTGSVIIQANYEPDKIAALVTKQKNHAVTQVGDHTLHTFTLKKQPKSSPSGDMEMTVVMVDSQTLLLASSEQNAREILRLLAGEAPSLVDSPSKLVPKDATTAWMVGAAINLGDLQQHPVAMPILTQHERLHWTFGKTDDGQWYERADLVAADDQVAQKMETVLRGIVACESLYAHNIEPLQKLIDNVSVQRNGNVTGFNWQGAPETAIEAMNGLLSRAMTWKGLFVDDSK